MNVHQTQLPLDTANDSSRDSMLRPNKKTPVGQSGHAGHLSALSVDHPILASSSLRVLFVCFVFLLFKERVLGFHVYTSKLLMFSV